LARIGLLVRNTLGNAQIVERLKINMVDVDSAEASANVRGSYLLVAPKRKYHSQGKSGARQPCCAL
jgi:hypothetical protein